MGFFYYLIIQNNEKHERKKKRVSEPWEEKVLLIKRIGQDTGRTKVNGDRARELG